MTDGMEKAREAIKHILERNTYKTMSGKSVLTIDAEFARDALAALDAEKPAEDVREIAQNILGMALSNYDGLDRLLENDTRIAADMIQSYAESYAAKKCATCRGEAFPRFEKRSGITTDVDYNPAESPDTENRPEEP